MAQSKQPWVSSGEPSCGCSIEYGDSEAGFPPDCRILFCPKHAQAPEMYGLLEMIINYFEPLESIPRELSVRQSKWLDAARRIKAEIDGE